MYYLLSLKLETLKTREKTKSFALNFFVFMSNKFMMLHLKLCYYYTSIKLINKIKPISASNSNSSMSFKLVFCVRNRKVIQKFAKKNRFKKVVGFVVVWLEGRDCDRHGLGSKHTYCCVLGKDTLRHFPLLGGLGKQFKLSFISL